jgi:hypothetical protein
MYSAHLALFFLLHLAQRLVFPAFALSVMCNTREEEESLQSEMSGAASTPPGSMEPKRVRPFDPPGPGWDPFATAWISARLEPMYRVLNSDAPQHLLLS